MTTLTLTGAQSDNSTEANRIYCPTLNGLTVAQADLAFVMPRLDHNRAVRETPRQGDWAALLASDPFGSEVAMFSQLYALGYRGITNWPSSILLDGALRQSMSTIPASPEFEYAFLARAQQAGFRTLAFFISLAQGRGALKAGLKHLVLHPGLLEVETRESSALVLGSLQRIIDTIRTEAPDATIYAYTSDWHERSVPLSTLEVDGLVRCEATA
ncbi:hypothetical protein RUESEDTHA_01531 [Ruegeria sp. THAF57]|uniref:phosphoenolpyruvate hydrolase family protein n=1 Tax=Ruegeria sp. THAF57 TaxID=2744555 RepID=UPI0015E00996|nr:phosphoenolpyruvate hydrolase family protein [Ruegeria sp. THAF57]CAD0184649.1 hypothetical protein RUESEDTHA_01531 [Ruegeria sp. THAF57]